VSPRNDDLRLGDIAEALTAMGRHLKRGSIEDELVFDACGARLIEIGEAVKGLDTELLKLKPDVPWREIARMRDHLTHRYCDAQHDILRDVVINDPKPLLTRYGIGSRTPKLDRRRSISTKLTHRQAL
jgi:uncharacterized protein with HEPN domain